MSEVQKTRTRKIRTDNYSLYIFKVLKEVHPDLSISQKSMRIMDDITHDIFDRIASEAARIARKNHRSTLLPRDIHAAVKLIFGGELAKHAAFAGTLAIAKSRGN
jgi:histone H2B